MYIETMKKLIIISCTFHLTIQAICLYISLKRYLTLNKLSDNYNEDRKSYSNVVKTLCTNILITIMIYIGGIIIIEASLVEQPILHYIALAIINVVIVILGYVWIYLYKKGIEK